MLLTVLITGAIIIVWILAGSAEWRLPSNIEHKVIRLGGQMDDHTALTVLAREFDFEDIEKEIYIIRKSAKSGEGLVMNIDMTDNERTKERLEKRFPGLTVNFMKRKNIL